jgi:hypothetical protein
MTNYDLCLAWNWEHDADFVTLLEAACASQGLSLLQITPNNLAAILESLVGNDATFRAFWDRASEADAAFAPVVWWARDQAIFHINPHEQALRTWDKAAMHWVLIGAGLYVPCTLVLPSYQEQPVLPSVDLGLLGDRFTIKPAHGGGGDGVIMEATELSQVLTARQEYPADQYLLQAHIVPAELDSRPAWYRVLYCAGQIYPCWWDMHTHVYTPVTAAEEDKHGLRPLHDITASIAHLCGLDLFSTEIALTGQALFVVVDYINDQIDLRLQSKAVDGVPDAIVGDVARRLAALVKAHCP